MFGTVVNAFSDLAKTVFARRGGLVMGINVPAISLVTHDNRTGKKDTPYPVFFLPA